ncbi:MAG: c-type cytochrome, partial [Planctomycetaceae bacterium]|nr:c-type cytochrome [Planctomycetaceae bacterium]
QLAAQLRNTTPGAFDWAEFLQSAEATGLDQDAWLPVMLQVFAGDDPALLVRNVGATLGIQSLREFAQAVGRKNSPDEVLMLLQEFVPRAKTELPVVVTVVVGLSEGLPGGRSGLTKSLKQLSTLDQQNFLKLVTLARKDLAAGEQATTDASMTIALQGLADDPESLEFLIDALTSLVNQQPVIISALAQRPEPSAGSALAEAIPQLSVSARNQAMAALGSSTPRIHLLLDLVESGQVPPLTVEPNLAKRLMSSKAADIKERAERLLKTAPPADRVQVLAEYSPCLTLQSNPQRGREIFLKNCATCHRVGDVGVNVAPDISDSRTKTPEYLLANILDPNRAIDNNFFSYTIVDTNGRVFTGVIESETSTTVTLKQPEAKVVSFARSDIEELKNNGVSLMPVGLERTIPPQDMADLISFIKNWRYLDGSVPKEVIRK